MNTSLHMPRYEKVGEILGGLQRKFKVPLEFYDLQERLLFSFETGGGETPYPGGYQMRSGAAKDGTPICHMGNMIGTLAVCLPPGANSEVASYIAYCLENSLKLEFEIEDLSSEIVSLYEELSLLYSISNKMGSEMEVDAICNQVLEEVDKLLSPQNMSIMLLDSSKKRLYTRHSIGRNFESARSFTTDISEGLIGHVFQTGDAATICDIRADKRITLPYPAKSVLCVPLLTDNRAIGLLLVCDKRSGDEFWSRELKLMSMFASEVAASIRKAQLYENNSKMFINTVEALASAIDAKDPYTYGHSKRVAQFSLSICERLGMPKGNRRFVELAALLHDIGKIGTPESILNKPGKLKPEEIDKIREHPAKGAEILSNIEEFSEIVKWIRHHHEWYDGKGYPDEISAKSIPLEARIITIADAYDAMTTDRPYRKGMPPTEAIKIMEEFNRSQFDPEILKEFRRIILNGNIFADPGPVKVPSSIRHHVNIPARNVVAGRSQDHIHARNSASTPFLHGKDAVNRFDHGGANVPAGKLFPLLKSHKAKIGRWFAGISSLAGKRALSAGLVPATVMLSIALSVVLLRNKSSEAPHVSAGYKTQVTAGKRAGMMPVPVLARQAESSDAFIKFRVRPWGEIYLDGKKQGVSPPLKHLHVKNGEHRIVIRNKALKPYRRNIALGPKEQLVIEHSFTTKAQFPAGNSVRRKKEISLPKTGGKINPAAFTAPISPQ